MASTENVSWVSISILCLAVVGVASNGACVAILIWKKRTSMFHRLLKILSFYDSLVIIGCSFLYALPGAWHYFKIVIYPIGLPYILPLTQISVMSSVYCTTLMSFERYARICYICQLRSNKLLSERAFRLFITAVAIFPILFYIPKFFEVRTETVTFQMSLDCSNYTELLQQINSGDKREHQTDLELIWNITLSKVKDQQAGEMISARDIFINCLQANYSVLSESKMVMNLENNITIYQLVPTGLRQSVTYYQVYSIFLNTLFATLLPVILLFYLNMSTVKALARMKKMEQETEQEHLELQSGVPAILITINHAEPNDSMLEHYSNKSSSESDFSKVDETLNSRESSFQPTEQTEIKVIPFENHKSIHQERNSDSGKMKLELDSSKCSLDGEQKGFCRAEFQSNDVKVTPSKSFKSEREEHKTENHLPVPWGGKKRGSFKSIKAQIENLRIPNSGKLMRSRCGSEVALNSRASEDRHRKTEDRLTRISMSIVWIFLFCHIWKLIPTIYEAVYSGETQVLTDWPRWLLIVNDISHTLIVFNSAVNFLIYVVL